jgi:hypothetical protein
MTDPTDWRALCAELLEALENAIRVVYGEDGTKHISTADAVITKADAALAQPEPQGPTDEELCQTLHQAICDFPPTHPDALNLNANQYEVALELRKARAAIARFGRLTIKPVPEGISQ